MIKSRAASTRENNCNTHWFTLVTFLGKNCRWDVPSDLPSFEIGKTSAEQYRRDEPTVNLTLGSRTFEKGVLRFLHSLTNYPKQWWFTDLEKKETYAFAKWYGSYGRQKWSLACDAIKGGRWSRTLNILQVKGKCNPLAYLSVPLILPLTLEPPSPFSPSPPLTSTPMSPPPL